MSYFVKCFTEVKKCLFDLCYLELAQSVVVIISCVIVDRSFLKPCCSLIKILFLAMCSAI